MITCPRCQQTVDEKTRVTCPVCFSQLFPATYSSSSDKGLSDHASNPSVIPLSIPSIIQAPPILPPLPPGGGAPGYAPPAAPGYLPIPHPASTLDPNTPSTSYQPPTGVYSAPMPGTLPNAPSQTNPGYSPPPTRTRISLTGEVIQDAAPTAPPSGYIPPTGSHTPASSPYRTSGSQFPGPLPLTSSAYASTSAPPKKSSNFWGVALGGGGIGIYFLFRIGLIALRFMTPHHSSPFNSNDDSENSRPVFSFGSQQNPYQSSLYDPKTAALAAMQAVHSQDWAKLFYVSHYGESMSKNEDDKNAYVKALTSKRQQDHNPLSLFNLMSTATSFDVGNGEIINGKCDIPTLWMVNINGQSTILHGVAHMAISGKSWGLDSTGIMTDTYRDLLGMGNEANSGAGNFQSSQPERHNFNPPMQDNQNQNNNVQNLQPTAYPRQFGQPPQFGRPPQFGQPPQFIRPPMFSGPNSGRHFGPSFGPDGRPIINGGAMNSGANQ